MMVFQESNSNIHVIARGIIVSGEDIVLCRLQGASWYFLPGGHVEDGESIKQALLREIQEEMGIEDVSVGSFVGVCENTFSLKESDVFQHEVNVVFNIDIPHDRRIDSMEDHIEFISIPLKDLGNYNLLPHSLKTGLLEWMEDGQTFFKEL